MRERIKVESLSHRTEFFEIDRIKHGINFQITVAHTPHIFRHASRIGDDGVATRGVPAQQSSHQWSRANVISHVPDKRYAGAPARTRAEDMHLEAVGVQHVRTQLMQCASQLAYILDGGRACTKKFFQQSRAAELRSGWPTRASISEPCQCVRKKQDTGAHSDRFGARDKRPVRSRDEMQRPLRLGPAQAGQQVEQSQLSASKLAGRVQVDDLHTA